MQKHKKNVDKFYSSRKIKINKFTFFVKIILLEACFQKEEQMENETLFNEEAEPPGPRTGLVKVENEVIDFFSLSKETHQPYPAKQKSDRFLFPFNDSPRSRIFRKRFYPSPRRHII